MQAVSWDQNNLVESKEKNHKTNSQLTKSKIQDLSHENKITL